MKVPFGSIRNRIRNPFGLSRRRSFEFPVLRVDKDVDECGESTDSSFEVCSQPGVVHLIESFPFLNRHSDPVSYIENDFAVKDKCRTIR